jgi:hypothetical protein
MTFEWALEMLKEGEKVKRKHWGGYWFITEVVIVEDASTWMHDTHESKMIIARLKEGGYAPAQAYQGDLLADDWEVAE